MQASMHCQSSCCLSVAEIVESRLFGTGALSLCKAQSCRVPVELQQGLMARQVARGRCRSKTSRIQHFYSPPSLATRCQAYLGAPVHEWGTMVGPLLTAASIGAAYLIGLTQQKAVPAFATSPYISLAEEVEAEDQVTMAKVPEPTEDRAQETSPSDQAVVPAQHAPRGAALLQPEEAWDILFQKLRLADAAPKTLRRAAARDAQQRQEAESSGATEDAASAYENEGLSLCLQGLKAGPRQSLLSIAAIQVHEAVNSLTDADKVSEPAGPSSASSRVLTMAVSGVRSRWLAEATSTSPHKNTIDEAEAQRTAAAAGVREGQARSSPAPPELDELQRAQAGSTQGARVETRKEDERAANSDVPDAAAAISEDWWLINNDKRQLYEEFVFWLRFKERRQGGRFKVPLWSRFASVILEDVVVAVAEAAFSALLDQWSSSDELLDGFELQSFLLKKLQSTRALERFRNEVALQRMLQQNFISVAAMYEDRYDLWAIEQIGAGSFASAQKIEDETSTSDSGQPVNHGQDMYRRFIPGIFAFAALKGQKTGFKSLEQEPIQKTTTIRGNLLAAFGHRHRWREGAVKGRGRRDATPKVDGGPSRLVVRRRSLPIRRSAELRTLGGWRLAYCLYLEFSDVTGPILKILLSRLGKLIQFLLVTLIGQSLGLVYKGIRQSLRFTGG